jgi:hypothetical protein
MMIAQPGHITRDLVEAAIESARRAKPLRSIDLVRLESFTEGKAAQVLHLGPYAEEWPTISELHSFIDEQGFRPTGKHHEIYLSDPRRSEPSKLRTLLRQPVGWTSVGRGIEPLGRLLVEEGGDHRGEPFVAVEHPAARGNEMGGPGEDRQPGGGQAGQIALTAPAAQSKQLDGVLGADRIGVAHHDHRRRGDPLDVGVRPGEWGQVEGLQLLDQCRELARVGGDLLVGRFER